MKRMALAVLASWSLLAGSAANAAYSEETEADLRCVAIVAVMAGQAPEEQRPGVVAGLMYFLGRFEAKAPTASLETEMRRVYAGLTPEVMAKEGQRCGTILTEKGTMLQAVGANLRNTK